MIRAKDQIPGETTYPNLAKFLQGGGTLEVGEDFLTGGFARIRKWNKVAVVHTAYRDLAAVLKQMDSLARSHLEEES